MENNYSITKSNTIETKKSYLWILLLASLGMWIGLFLKLFIINTFYVTKSKSGLPGLPTAEPQQLWLLEFMQIIIPIAAGFLGFILERKRNYEINIVWKVVGYLIIIPTLLFTLSYMFGGFILGGPQTAVYFVPLVFIAVLCLIKK